MDKKVVVIHQPDFLPYLGFFHRLLYSDLYIVFDNVQFLRRGWHHRDQIKVSPGKKYWLTTSVVKAPRETLINKILLGSNVEWKVQHLDTLKKSYKIAKYFNEIFPYIEKLYQMNTESLSEFNMQSIFLLLELFDIKIDTVYSSNFQTITTKSERLVELLSQVQATHYLSGIGAKAYHEDKPFDQADIKVIWQEFKHPVYPQLYGEFIPYLSSIDLLFNCGIKKSREILRSI